VAGRQERRRVHRHHADAVEGDRAAQHPGCRERELADAEAAMGEETSLKQWRPALCTNFTGSIQVARTVVPRLRAQGGGRI
jgi:NAD(P)-dependent dehydrogenase (short-subunit alcohol dehydrogenase family)